MSFVDRLPRPRLPKMTGVIETLGAQNKAIFGGLMAANAPGVQAGFDTLLLALLAWFGLGQMPPDAALIEAIRAVLWGAAAWLIVYMVPNIARPQGQA
jgi:hypothetical protein